jgi:hypothetical protein
VNNFLQLKKCFTYSEHHSKGACDFTAMRMLQSRLAASATRAAIRAALAAPTMIDSDCVMIACVGGLAHVHGRMCRLAAGRASANVYCVSAKPMATEASRSGNDGIGASRNGSDGIGAMIGASRNGKDDGIGAMIGASRNGSDGIDASRNGSDGIGASRNGSDGIGASRNGKDDGNGGQSERERWHRCQSEREGRWRRWPIETGRAMATVANRDGKGDGDGGQSRREGRWQRRPIGQSEGNRGRRVISSMAACSSGSKGCQR